MSETALLTLPIYGPPLPVRLDDVVFFNARPEIETAWRDGELIGQIDLVKLFARKLVGGANDEWRRMRSRAEARSFLVSRIRQ